MQHPNYYRQINSFLDKDMLGFTKAKKLIEQCLNGTHQPKLCISLQNSLNGLNDDPNRTVSRKFRDISVHVGLKPLYCLRKH